MDINGIFNWNMSMISDSIWIHDYFLLSRRDFPMPSSDPQWSPGRDPGPCGGQGCSPSRVMRSKVRSKKWRTWQLRRVLYRLVPGKNGW